MDFSKIASFVDDATVSNNAQSLDVPNEVLSAGGRLARLIREVEDLEAAAGENVGSRIDQIFRDAIASRATSIGELSWKMSHLRRRVENGWSERDQLDVIDSVITDLAHMNPVGRPA